jgi:membrane protease YdiL (CAAX protease family)
LAEEAPSLIAASAPLPAGIIIAFIIALLAELVGSVLLAIPFIRGRVQPRWDGYLLPVVLGLAIGPLVFLTIQLIEALAGWADIGAGSISAAAFGAAFVTFVFVAFSEEILARGFLLQILERRYGTLAGVIGSTAIFSLLHISNPGATWAALIGLVVAGLLFAYAYLATRQLWLPIALHLSWNCSEGPIFGFPVSGLQGPGLLDPNVSGPPAITGGAFGPEGGLVGLLGVGLAAAMIAAYQRAVARRGKGEARKPSSTAVVRREADYR